MPDGDADRNFDAFLDRALKDPNVRGIEVTEKPLPDGLRHRKLLILKNADDVNRLLKADQRMKNLLAGLFYVIVIGVFLLAVAFIVAGVWLVVLGATGTTQVEIFGAKISSTNVGIVSIFFGAVVVLVLIRKAMSILGGLLK